MQTQLTAISSLHSEAGSKTTGKIVAVTRNHKKNLQIQPMRTTRATQEARDQVEFKMRQATEFYIFHNSLNSQCYFHFRSVGHLSQSHHSRSAKSPKAYPGNCWRQNFTGHILPVAPNQQRWSINAVHLC